MALCCFAITILRVYCLPSCGNYRGRKALINLRLLVVKARRWAVLIIAIRDGTVICFCCKTILLNILMCNSWVFMIIFKFSLKESNVSWWKVRFCMNECSFNALRYSVEINAFWIYINVKWKEKCIHIQSLNTFHAECDSCLLWISAEYRNEHTISLNPVALDTFQLSRSLLYAWIAQIVTITTR